MIEFNKKLIDVVQTNKEYHSNGNLKYISSIVILNPNKAWMFPERYINQTGLEYIKVDKTAKYKKDGSIVWELNYDEYGNLIKNLKGNKCKH